MYSGFGQSNGGYAQQPGQQPLYSQQTGYQPQFQGGYGQFQQQQQQQQQMPPQTSFGQPMAPPATSFGMQQTLYPQQTGYIQPQQTGYIGTPQYGLQPQATGYTSQQLLQSQPTGFTAAAQQIEKNEDLKIPNIRLSFITAADQQKFEQLFRSAVSKGSNAISDVAARDILLKSGLQATQLSRIWELSDLNKSGQLLFPEFCLSLHLVNLALRGQNIPYELDSRIRKEVEGFVDAINFSIPDNQDSKPKTPFDNLSQLAGLQLQQPSQPMPQISFGGYQSLQPQVTGFQSLQPQITGYQPLQPQRTGFIQPQATGYSQPLMPQSTGYSQPLMSQSTGYQPLMPQATGFNPPALLQAQKTGVGNNSFFQSSLLQPQKTGFQNLQQYATYQNQEFIKPAEKAQFSKIFDTYDSNRTGQLNGKICAEIFRKSGLNRQELEKVWNLVNTADRPFLDKEAFSLGMWLIYKKLNGHELPKTLPEALLPKSTSILNGVKDAMRLTTPAFSNKPFGSSTFKNDDSDLLISKNRRATIDKAPEVTDIELLKTQIEVQKATLEGLSREGSSSAPAFNGNDLKAIEDLKNQIRSLPKPAASDEKARLKERLNSLTSKVPDLIREISRIDNEITNSKIELYKVKNPSSIVGSGPNGEVTEADKRKAKSKALLAQRMAALTGKPVNDQSTDFETQQQKFNEEVSKVKDDNKKNQGIIYDIEKTIKELSQGAQSTLSQGTDGLSYRKFELGVDVEPEVAELIKELRISKTPTPQTYSHSPPVSAPVSASKAAPPPVGPKPSTPDMYSSYKTPEEKAAYIKEQAKKRMNEKLARFGIHRSRDDSTPSTAATTPPPQPAPAEPVAEPVAKTIAKTVAPLAPAYAAHSKTAPPPPPPISRTLTVKKEDPAEDDDDDDEEEKRLREQLEALKLKKKAEKEARLAKLHKELEDAENDDEEASAPSKVQTFAPSHATSVTKAVEQTPKPVHHDTNPFAKSAPAASTEPVAPSASSNNPFGKPQQQFFKSEPVPVAPAFDHSKIEAQRKAQRGLENDDDDGWGSDDGKEDSDEERLPSRQGAAQLAGMLFSGMGQAKVASSSQVSTPKEEKPTPVPIAAPIPSVSSAPAAPIAAPIPSASSAPAIPSVQPVHPVAATLVYAASPSDAAAPAVVPASTSAAPVAPAIPSAPTVIPTHPQFSETEPLERAIETSAAPAVPEALALPESPVPRAPPVPQGIAPPVPPETISDVTVSESISRNDSDEFTTPTASSPVPESESFATEPQALSLPPVPQGSAPPVPLTEAPPLPEVSAPVTFESIASTPQAPEVSAPPIPEFSVPEIPQDALPPVPSSSAPPLPDTYVPPLPENSAPPPPPLPEVSAPPAPPLPAFGAPPAPVLPAAPAPQASAPAASAAAASGLPFLAEIQKRRDERFVVE